jgi:hypothetical protein
MGTILYSWNSIPKAVPVSTRDAYYHTRDVIRSYLSFTVIFSTTIPTQSNGINISQMNGSQSFCHSPIDSTALFRLQLLVDEKPP